MLHVPCCQARQLSELLDFAEQERATLLEREASLQHELEQVGANLPDQSCMWLMAAAHGLNVQSTACMQSAVMQAAMEWVQAEALVGHQHRQTISCQATQKHKPEASGCCCLLPLCYAASQQGHCC